MACIKKKVKKKENIKQLMARARAIEIEKELEESTAKSISNETDTKNMVSKYVNQVYYRKVLID
jgi:hypothetical protein